MNMHTWIESSEETLTMMIRKSHQIRSQCKLFWQEICEIDRKVAWKCFCKFAKTDDHHQGYIVHILYSSGLEVCPSLTLWTYLGRVAIWHGVRDGLLCRVDICEGSLSSGSLSQPSQSDVWVFNVADQDTSQPGSRGPIADTILH